MSSKSSSSGTISLHSKLAGLSDETRSAIHNLVSRIDQLSGQRGTGAKVLRVHEIASQIERTLYQGNRSKFRVLDDNGYLNQHTERTYEKCILQHGQTFIDHKAIPLGQSGNQLIEPSTIAREVVESALKVIMGSRQVSRICTEVDMFTSDVKCVRSNDGEGRIVIPFKELSERDHDIRVIDDFRQHFPEFDDLLQFLVDARFAPDRRRAFVWLHVQANWGKSFLLDVFKNLGLVISTDESEIEKALNGGPIGIDLSQFKYAWILHVDEFRKPKSELKRLNNEITGSAKHQLATRLHLYAKIFTSAESVAGLTGELGVEKQFADRFNYLTGQGEIDKRPLFQQVGAESYRQSLEGYVAERLNAGVRQYQALGIL